MPLKALLLTVLLTTLLLSQGCVRHYARGSVNDIAYDMSLDRPAIPGGVPYSIDIRMDEGSATEGNLTVDGVSFGRVRSGDEVVVTDRAEVLVNGVQRDPPKAAP